MAELAAGFPETVYNPIQPFFVMRTKPTTTEALRLRGSQSHRNRRICWIEGLL